MLTWKNFSQPTNYLGVIFSLYRLDSGGKPDGHMITVGGKNEHDPYNLNVMQTSETQYNRTHFHMYKGSLFTSIYIFYLVTQQ